MNDCAREMMASIRTVFQDAQFFDPDLTPTFVNATSFTVPTDQTSAMQVGRRIKMFDGGNVNYGEILAASFTAVTTISVSAASAMTASLSSFALSIITGGGNNSGLPRRAHFDFLTADSMAVPGNISVSTLVATGPTRLENLSVSNIVATGPAFFGSTVSLSATLASRQVLGAWVRFDATAASVTALWNVNTISRSAAGVYRITFSTFFPDGNYGFHINAYVSDGSLRTIEHVSIGATAIKFRTRDLSTSVNDASIIVASFFR